MWIYYGSIVDRSWINAFGSAGTRGIRHGEHTSLTLLVCRLFLRHTQAEPGKVNFSLVFSYSETDQGYGRISKSRSP